MNDLLKRHRATEATLERYRHKSFDWATGVTCVHLARCQMRNMGHRPPGLPRFRSALGARQALKSQGWDNVEDMLNAILGPPIPPAKMLLGDLALAPGEEGLGSIMVCAGPHKLLGWREDAPELVVLDVQLDELTGAWRL